MERLYTTAYFRAERLEKQLVAVRKAVADAKACGGEDAGCTVDHRDIITAIIDGEQPPATPAPAAISLPLIAPCARCHAATARCDTKGRFLCQRCDSIEQASGEQPPEPAPSSREVCCVCGSPDVGYHNCNEQAFCWPCADCGCNQTPCVRTGVNDPAVSSEADEPEAAMSFTDAVETATEEEVSGPDPDEPEEPCFHPAWETTDGARKCTDCGEWLDPQPLEPVPEPGDTELTADEARAEVDRLATDLYQAQDALAFVAEMCNIADRANAPVTTARVRDWLKGAQCARQAGLVLTRRR
jgi:hypothetical protein